MNAAKADRFALSDELIDGSVVTTEWDALSRRYHTVHTSKGVPVLKHMWLTQDDARSGHSQALREITALIASSRS